METVVSFIEIKTILISVVWKYEFLIETFRSCIIWWTKKIGVHLLRMPIGQIYLISNKIFHEK